MRPDLKYDNNWYQEEDKDTILCNIRIIPGAKKEAFIISDPVPKLKIRQRAHGGGANKGIKKYFSKKFNVAQGKISFVRGEWSRNKVIRIQGITLKTFLDVCHRIAARES